MSLTFSRVIHDRFHRGLEPLFDAAGYQIGCKKEQQQGRDDRKGDEEKNQAVLEAPARFLSVFVVIHFQYVADQDEQERQGEQNDDDPKAENDGVPLEKEEREVLALFEKDADHDEYDEQKGEPGGNQPRPFDAFSFHSMSTDLLGL